MRLSLDVRHADDAVRRQPSSDLLRAARTDRAERRLAFGVEPDRAISGRRRAIRR